MAAVCAPATAQNTPHAANSPPLSNSTAVLEREFFAALRAGDAKAFLSYIPAEGVNLGTQPRHVSRAEVEAQFLHHRDLYCKLFDSSCIQAPLKLDNSLRACSYRELLTQSKSVRTAATETVRNGVRQAFLVAEVKDNGCSGLGLVDFIFNYEHGAWKLFSVP